MVLQYSIIFSKKFMKNILANTVLKKKIGINNFNYVKNKYKLNDIVEKFGSFSKQIINEAYY